MSVDVEPAPAPPAPVRTEPARAIKVTPQEEHFARLVVTGYSRSASYRRAYAVKDGTKPSTVWEASSRIAARPKVAARIDQLKEQAAARAGVTRETMLAEMAENRTLAIDAGEVAAANTASRDRARVGGLLKDADESGSGNVTINVQINGADSGLL